jgi:hypothetical protein
MPLACLGALRVLDRADERSTTTVEEAEVGAAIAADVTSDTPVRIPRPARRRLRPAWVRPAWALPGRRRPAAVVPAAAPPASNGAATESEAGGGEGEPPAVCPPAAPAGDVLP